MKYEFSTDLNIESAIRMLRKFGVVHIPNYLKPSQLGLLNDEFESLLHKPSLSILSQQRHPINEDGRTARFNPWHKAAPIDFPQSTEVFRHEFMNKIAASYFLPNRFELNDEVFITHELPSKNQILPWHFDRVQSLKFWFNLTDTTKKNGAFEYCPGSHREGHYRAGFHMSQGISVEDIPNDIDEELILNPVTLELKAGDLLIFDPDGFHRGGVVQPGEERRVLRGHTHPKGLRRYNDRPLTAGWWLKSFLNLNKWTGNASKRVLGKKVQDKTVNRKKTQSIAESSTQNSDL